MNAIPTRLVGLLLALIFLAAACGDGDADPTSTATPGVTESPATGTASPTATVAPTESATPAPTATPDDAPDGAEDAPFSLDPIDETARSGNGVIVAIRVAAHDGYDRFVLEFGDELTDALILADGVPAYRVDYIDGPAVECGSGMDVALDGSAILEVHLPGSFIYDPDTGTQTVEPLELTDDYQVIREAEEICGFEGISTWVLGVDGEQPFRIFELSDPTRLVIDVEADTQ